MSKTVHRQRDPQSLAIARASAQGDKMPVINHRGSAVKEIVTDFEEEVTIAGKILAGELGFPPIVFGVELEIGTRGGRDGKKPFPVIVFIDATTDCPLFQQLNQGFWIPLSSIRMKLNEVQFRGLDDQLFATYLSTQKAVQTAKQRHWEAQTAVAEATAADEKKSLIAKMLANSKQTSNQKPAPQEFGPGLLGEAFGEYRHPSGVVLLLYKSQRFDNHLISVVECPDDHELVSAKKAQAFVHQAHVKNFPTERAGEKLEGILGKAQELRVWLRRELRAVGALPPLEKVEGEASTVVTEVPAASPAAVETSPAPATANSQSVAVAEVLPAGIQVLPNHESGSHFPAKAKRTARLTSANTTTA